MCVCVCINFYIYTHTNMYMYILCMLFICIFFTIQKNHKSFLLCLQAYYFLCPILCYKYSFYHVIKNNICETLSYAYFLLIGWLLSLLPCTFISWWEEKGGKYLPRKDVTQNKFLETSKGKSKIALQVSGEGGKDRRYPQSLCSPSSVRPWKGLV